MRVAVATFTVAAALLASSAGRAAPLSDDPAIIGALAVGTLSGLVSVVATAVYAADERAFDSAWIPIAFFSSAVCGSFTVALFAYGASDGFDAGTVVAMLLFGGLSGVPLYWTIKSSLSPAPPGERFDAALPPEPPAVGAGPRPALTFPLFAIEL